MVIIGKRGSLTLASGLWSCSYLSTGLLAAVQRGPHRDPPARRVGIGPDRPEGLRAKHRRESSLRLFHPEGPSGRALGLPRDGRLSLRGNRRSYPVPELPSHHTNFSARPGPALKSARRGETFCRGFPAGQPQLRVSPNAGDRVHCDGEVLSGAGYTPQ